jgi:hypothetical protein
VEKAEGFATGVDGGTVGGGDSARAVAEQNPHEPGAGHDREIGVPVAVEVGAGHLARIRTDRDRGTVFAEAARAVAEQNLDVVPVAAVPDGDVELAVAVQVGDRGRHRRRPGRHKRAGREGQVGAAGGRCARHKGHETHRGHSHCDRVSPFHHDMIFGRLRNACVTES